MTLPPANLQSPSGAPAAAPLDLRRLAWTTALGILGLMTILGLLAWLFREPLEALGRQFVAVLGGPGVALGFFIPDAFTVPLPNDAFSMFGLIGGMPYWTVVFWGTVGSLLGGTTGFFIGRLLQRTVWFQQLLARRGSEIHGLVRRYGPWAIAAAALTPLPYSIACWTAGAMDMRFSVFIAVSLLRVVRVAGYLWLIQAGFFTLGA